VAAQGGLCGRLGEGEGRKAGWRGAISRAHGRDGVIAGGDACQVTGQYFSEADNLQEFSHNTTGQSAFS